ncbi:MAG: shikimate kinase [Actinomycetota bacterium]|nr:shikimate kinase [Actinomycetota bacterium]
MSGHVYLVGMPGSGKSTAGRALAQMLGLPFVDLDDEIERAAGCSIPEIFQEQGEPRFRELEREALERAASGPHCVVACGGGVPLREDNRVLMRSTGTVVALDVPVKRLWTRVAAGMPRPLVTGPVDVRRIDRERRAVYRDVAHHRVDGAGEPAEVAGRIAEALR